MTEQELYEQFEHEDTETFKRGLRAMLETFEGRSVIWEWTAGTGVWDTSPYASDPLAMAHATGRQSVGLELIHKLVALGPEVWPNLQQEMLEVAAKRQQQIDNADEVE